MIVHILYSNCDIICIYIGDNLHTAISVARDCDMIKEGHKVIMLQATDNGGQGVSLNYSIVGDDVSCTEDTGKLLTESCNSELQDDSITFKVWCIYT